VLNKTINGLVIVWARLIEQGIRVTAVWAVDHVVRIATGAPIRRVSEITPGVHVGGQHRERGWARLRARGITAVVNMRSEFDETASGLASERHLYLPTVDDTAPRMEDLRAGVAFITEEIEGGGSVYIHCASGVGRAPTMAAAYLVSRGLTPAEAWAKIRAARPFVRPQPSQIAQVEAFAEQLQREDDGDREPRLD
jgi:predicted protein tyrosine phosphatase